MDAFSTADVFYTLAEEKFDFDVSMSSASSREDGGEDEVFVGPVTDEGKVTVHLAMDSVSSGPSSVAEEQLWSPCSGEDFDRVCSEAQKLSTRFEDRQTDGTAPAERQDHMAVDFVQDAGAKLDMFSKPFTRALSPIKRETFCVQDSPVKLLPPAIQKRLLKGGSSSSSSSVGSGVRDRVNSSRARLNTSSPGSGSSKTRTQPKMALRSKAGLGSSGILPSKPLVPATSSASSLKTAKTRAVPAENASRLAPSSKVGLRSKAHPLQARGVVDARRHAPSSSLSSLNSNMSVSPTGKGKLSASLNTSTSGPSSRAPTSMNRLASTSTAAAKTRRCTPVGRAADPPPPPPAAAAAVKGLRRSSSFSVQSRKMSDTTDPTKLARSTPVKRAVPSTPTPFQQSPAKRASVSSVSSQQPLGPPRAKPMAFIAPNPSTRLSALKRSETVVHSPDPLKIKIPMRLRSAVSLDSLLQEKVVPNSHLFQSTPSVSRIRRPSALPNPVNRSVISGIPAMTPSRLPGSGPADAFFSARKTSNQSSTRVDSAASEEMVVSPKKQLFSLEDADPAALQTQMQNEALTCVKGQSLEAAQEVVENTLPQQEVVENPEENVAPRQEVEENMESQKEIVENPEENQEPEPIVNLIELQSVEEVISEVKTEEILLMDVPVSMFKPEDKPLIDLSNTPDLIRTVSHKDGEIQLIDLTSPLMKWSPEKKENVNEAPLINFSF